MILIFFFPTGRDTTYNRTITIPNINKSVKSGKSPDLRSAYDINTGPTRKDLHPLDVVLE